MTARGRRALRTAAGVGGVPTGIALVVLALGFAYDLLRLDTGWLVVVGVLMIGGSGPAVLAARLIAASRHLQALAAVPDDEDDDGAKPRRPPRRSA